jgi:hypothetical protein
MAGVRIVTLKSFPGVMMNLPAKGVVQVEEGKGRDEMKKRCQRQMNAVVGASSSVDGRM